MLTNATLVSKTDFFQKKKKSKNFTDPKLLNGNVLNNNVIYHLIHSFCFFHTHNAMSLCIGEVVFPII